MNDKNFERLIKKTNITRQKSISKEFSKAFSDSLAKTDDELRQDLERIPKGVGSSLIECWSHSFNIKEENK